MFRAKNSPILRSSFWLYIQLVVQCTDTAADTVRQQCRCIVPKPVYTVKKCSWGWANLSPETCRAELKRLIKEKSYCILLVRGTGRQQCRWILPKAVYTVKKSCWGWANFSPETCGAELKKINKRKSCCILLVVYIVVLKWCTVTQTSSYINIY